MPKIPVQRPKTLNYDPLFVIEMRELISRRVDFELTARKVLRKVLGESSSDVLITMLGEEGLRDPEAFARGTQRLLGTGSYSLCVAVMEYASELVTKGRSLEN